MSYTQIDNTGFIDIDGNYSETTQILVFDGTALSKTQWETLGELSDNSRMSYVQAIMNGDDLSEWEN
jgi:hypothetical protein